MADMTLDTRVPQRAPERIAQNRFLRVTAAIFAVAVVVHGADHVRRGIDVATAVVRNAGAIQFALGAVAVVLVFRGHRWAPAVAVFVGFASAAGFGAAHLLPHWSAFSDPYTGSVVAPHVNAFSWFSALFEIAADIAFGMAGLSALWVRG
jgi:hypothetical protein